MSKIDERFKKLGFILDINETDIENEIILYRKGARILEINKDESYFYIDETAQFQAYNTPTFTFSLYEKIKPIVEGKKREVGWIK